VIILLALVVALDAADKATLGAVAAELQSKLGIPRDVATAAASERATA
jgi:hypothetical protein